MKLMKHTFCLLLILALETFAHPSRPGEKIHFQDSAELEQLDIDRRPGPASRDIRNHRGRAVGHEKKNNVPEFEQGLPGVYPIRGPVQAPLVLPTPPGQGLGLQNNKPVELNTPAAKPSNQQQPIYYHYAGNPFLSKPQTDTAASTTNKYTPTSLPGVTNQLPSSDKPSTIATKTPTTTTLNPRRIDLLYGSNLLEEDAKREGKAETTTDVSFGDRGLFDSAPHCQPGHILVNNKCRLAV